MSVFHTSMKPFIPMPRAWGAYRSGPTIERIDAAAARGPLTEHVHRYDMRCSQRRQSERVSRAIGC